MSGFDGLYKFVLIAEIPLFEAQGWVLVSLLGGRHGFHAVLMQLGAWE